MSMFLKIRVRLDRTENMCPAVAAAAHSEPNFVSFVHEH